MSYSKSICLAKENEFGKLPIVFCCSRQTSIFFVLVQVNFVAECLAISMISSVAHKLAKPYLYDLPASLVEKAVFRIANVSPSIKVRPVIAPIGKNVPAVNNISP